MDIFSISQLLQECVVKDGRILLSKNDEETVRAVGDRLRQDLLARKIPHYRVVGVRVETGTYSGMSNYVIKSKDVSRSYAELLGILKDLIYAEPGGKCCVTKDDPDLERQFEAMHNTSFMYSVDADVRSDNGTILYSGGDSRIVNGLVKDVEIIKAKSNSFGIYFMLCRSTDSMEFVESEALIRKLKQYKRDCFDENIDGIEYVPIRQAFDMTEIFTIWVYKPGDTAIRLRYKKPINEEVLQEIIRRYAVDLRCSNDTVEEE